MTRRYPFSAGDGAVGIALPPGACDCHVHVYDHQTPAAPGAVLHPPPASVTDYLQIQQRMGTQRVVLVTPSTYGANNAPLLAGLEPLGAQARGVAVIQGDEADSELQALHARGVRGVRINLSLGVIHDQSSVAKLAERIAPLGWHLQLLMAADEMVAMASVLDGLPVDLVFDHFGRISPAQCEQHPAHALLLRWLREQRAWVKLSGGYLVSPTGTVEDPALDRLARSYLDAAPERVLWGSDWPHATASAGRQPFPDDVRQIERLAQWAGGEDQLTRILVHNPQRLYGFAPIPLQ